MRLGDKAVTGAVSSVTAFSSCLLVGPTKRVGQAGSRLSAAAAAGPLASFLWARPARTEGCGGGPGSPNSNGG